MEVLVLIPMLGQIMNHYRYFLDVSGQYTATVTDANLCEIIITENILAFTVC